MGRELVILFPRAFRQPNFGRLMRRYRSGHRLTLQAVARESGVPIATWDRAEAGQDVRLSTVTKVVDWIQRRGKPEGRNEDDA